MRTATVIGAPKMVKTPRRKLYFAYGSNLNVEQFFKRCPAARRFGICALPNYRLFFDGVADIMPAPGQEVAGAIYEITPKCERALDRYEGFPNLYEKATFEIEYTDDKGQKRQRKVMFYTMNSTTIQEPSPGYVWTIRQGFDDWRLPHDTLNAAVAEACPAPRQKPLPRLRKGREYLRLAG